MFYRFYIIVLLLFFAASQASAHGGAKLGPNGGYIRMPGAFHTEVVPTEDGLNVYLLDLDLKNPTTKQTSLEVALRKGSQQTALSCSVASNYYSCRLPAKTKVATGDRYLVKATREGAVAGVAQYETPFRLGNY